jgi:hypothetical protein
LKDLQPSISDTKASWIWSVIVPWDFFEKLPWRKMKEEEVSTSSFNKQCCCHLHFDDLQLSQLLVGFGVQGGEDGCGWIDAARRWREIWLVQMMILRLMRCSSSNAHDW